MSYSDGLHIIIDSTPEEIETAMKVLTAKVMEGCRLDVPEDSLQEGETVILLVPDAGEAFELSPEEKSQLLEAMAQADRGEAGDGW
jgi:hypothetical protein